MASLTRVVAVVILVALVAIILDDSLIADTVATDLTDAASASASVGVVSIVHGPDVDGISLVVFLKIVLM